eukprot:SAG31_NODE_1254_length_9087_cov_12.553071_2_plen_75_part_00
MGKLPNIVAQLLVLVGRIRWPVPVIRVLHVVVHHHTKAIARVVEGRWEKYTPSPYLLRQNKTASQIDSCCDQCD